MTHADDPRAQRRAAALNLANELLDDVELTRLAAPDLVRKTSRLARLLDDHDAMAWLRWEIGGYPTDELGADAWAAATRSHRVRESGKDGPTAVVQSVASLQASVWAYKAQLSAATDAPVSITSANPDQYVSSPQGNTRERANVTTALIEVSSRLDRVVGAIHSYIADRQTELRFGAAVETAFEQVRNFVDGQVAAVVPDALPKLAAAFENAASANPEHWAEAAGTCRRLLKAVADTLQPPGGPIDGHPMGDGQYINRLVAWIKAHTESGTLSDVMTSDLEHFGKRLDAVAGAGHKGAHADVTRFDASRFITGTYLLLGDILRLQAGDPPTK